MQLETSSQIIERIRAAEGAAPDGRGVVAFDGDGTLWSGDVGEDFFHAFVEHGDVRAPAEAALVREAKELGIDPTGGGAVVARRLFAEYEAGRFGEERTCEMIAWLAAGWGSSELAAFTARLVFDVGLRARLHGEAVEVLAWAKEEPRLEVFVVSASPRAIVSAAVKVVGIPEERVLAASAVWADDRMQPAVERPIPYGPGKVHHLEARFGGRPLLAAFGDNGFDADMLARAAVAAAVRPKPRLRARADEIAGLVELAPRL